MINNLCPIIISKSPPGLSSCKEEAQLREAFKSYDSDGDGKLSKEELKKAFKYLGAIFSGFTAARAMSHADADDSGFVEISSQEMESLVKYAFKCGYEIC